MQAETYLQNQKQRWVQAIEQDNLKWEYHVSDLKKWESDAAALYDVRSIPRAFMIDKEGRIVSTSVRGAEQIEAELIKLGLDKKTIPAPSKGEAIKKTLNDDFEAFYGIYQLYKNTEPALITFDDSNLTLGFYYFLNKKGIAFLALGESPKDAFSSLESGLKAGSIFDGTYKVDGKNLNISIRGSLKQQSSINIKKYNSWLINENSMSLKSNIDDDFTLELVEKPN
jgi:hypothetical protein